MVGMLIPSVSMVTLPVSANPSGANVVHGAVNFSGLGTGSLSINQSSAAAIIDWQKFSIAAGESTHFNQTPGAIALNRVVSGNPSSIYGSLTATGSIIVINPNGIMVGPSGIIDVGGSLTLSTLDIDNNDFLNGGSERYFGSSANGVTNYGNIRAGGDAMFFGGFAHNFGSVEALRGTVALASGSDIVVDRSGDSTISVRGASIYEGIGVDNQGSLTGAGASLQSHGNAYALAVNNGGMVRATGGYRKNGRSVLKAMGSSSRVVNSGTVVATNPNGRGGDISVVGSEFENTGVLDVSSNGANDAGTVNVIAESLTFSDDSQIKANSLGNSGSVNLRATGTANVGGDINVSSQYFKGGEVIITADEVMVNADINAGGASGGVIKVGGDFQGTTVNGIEASSKSLIGSDASFDVTATAGDAGQIIVWSDGDTIFEGEARANATGAVGNGGLIEVSGKQNLTFRGLVSATSLNGNSGTVLFDPGELRVLNTATPGVNEIANETINDLLQGGTSVLLATQGADSDIIFVDTGLSDNRHGAIQWTNSNASFGAFAGGNVIVGTHIRTSGSGSINLIGGWTGTEAEAAGLLAGTIASPDGINTTGTTGATGALSVQNIFNYYVSAGQFGADGGNVIVGSATMNRHVEVGSRYGDTNIAADSILLIAADTNGESRHAQIGFRDSGQVFSPRSGLDLNDRGLEGNDDPLVGIVGNAFGQERLDGEGVFAINSFGIIANRTAADLDIYTDGVDLVTSNTNATVNFNVNDTGGGQSGVLIDSNNALSAVSVLAYGDEDGDDIPNIFDDSTDIGGTIYVGFAVDFDADGIAEVRTADIGDGSVGTQRANFSFTKGLDGTIAIRQDGAIKGLGVASGGATDYIGDTPVSDTLIPYANHYMDARQGNWWWQQIHHDSLDVGGADYVASYSASDLGGNRPEMGAGQSLANTADINLIAASNVLVQGGGRHQSGAYVGHGGDSAGWADNRALSSSGVEDGQAIQYWSQNGAQSDRSAMSIARLAPVYGHINVLAGVDPSAGVSINNSGEVSATIAGRGSVIVSGLQRLGASNSKNNDENNGASAGAPAVIGHGGIGQFGEFNGDIQVRAGGSVQVQAGSNSRGFAQIGHNIDTYHYWDPTSAADHQIRFFSSVSDFNDPLLRRGELFTGQTNMPISPILDDGVTTYTTSAGQVYSGDTFSGARNTTVMSIPSTGVLEVEALDGSVVSGFHGDITVEAVSGSVALQGYNTEDQSGSTGNGDPGDLGLRTNRDRRYARIGHGGTSSRVSGEHSGYAPNRTDRSNENVQYRIPTNANGPSGFDTGLVQNIGERGSALNRGATYVTITGDIAVMAGGNISVKAGNDTYDIAQIGHGGNDLADYETSGFIAGNIDVTAGGTLDIMGGGEVKWTGVGNNNTSSRHMRSGALVGHGGHQSGFLGYFGDITVNTGRDITITGGAYGDNYAKIGHKGGDDWGQVGGDFNRVENFMFDGVSTDITVNVSGNTGTITYGDGANLTTDGIAEIGGASATPRTFALTSNTANITVNSGGDVKLLHLDAQTRINENQANESSSVGSRTISQGQMQDAYAQIGHGGSNWGGDYSYNEATNYDHMVGNVSVTSANDVILEGGNREGAWSRIGHGITGTNLNIRISEEMLIGGAVTVNAARDVILDGSAAAEIDINEDQPAKDNGLAIGHGAFAEDQGGNRGRLTVLDGGTINGISLPSTITVNAGRDVTVIGGNGGQDVTGEIGTSGTHSQIGHGFSSIFGDSLSIRGFQGDINVSAQRDILLRATDNGIIHDAAGFLVYASSGGAAVIGNGGTLMDAPASGDISVYAGNDLSIVSPTRVDEDINLLVQAQFTNANFAKIGHFSTENQTSGVVNAGLMEGDITVVVGNDLTMSGGRTPDHSSGNFLDTDLNLTGDYAGQVGRSGVTAAFSQIGHGGPGVNANLLGDIEVLVQNDFITNDGTIDSSGQTLPFSANNYVKIGHGDWLREGTVGFRDAATGVMAGDIIVAVGNNADLEHTMIGHIDSTVSTGLPGAGSVYIAVSRNNPFYNGAGTGTFTATGVTDQVDAVGDSLIGTGLVSGSVFTSGSLGGDPLSIYIPQRDSNLIEVGTTRINSVSAFYHGNNGGGTPGGSGRYAGADDEVFLAPDLWWMSEEDIEAAELLGLSTGTFPASASVSNQGGVIATVGGVGGSPNVVTLTNGALGSSVNGSDYRVHGLSGGQYTMFYDAIVPVANGLPGPPPPPPIPPAPAPDLTPFVFNDLFDAFQRQEDGLDGIFGGDGFSGDLPYFGGSYDEMGVPGWFLEAFLDMSLGPRRSGPSSVQGGVAPGDAVYDEDGVLISSNSDIRAEDDEELERRLNRNNRPVGKVGMIYYLYTPGSGNPYSSFNLFGSPE